MSRPLRTPIEDYAVIGDGETAALVSRAGSIDWMCIPRFDSPACFAALLGTADHGHWLLGPAEPAESSRRYRGRSCVLETVHRTASGAVRVTDLMPPGDDRADLVRMVEGLEGAVEMEHEWVVRFGYGAIRPWVARTPAAGESAEALTAIAGPDMLVLRGDRLPVADGPRHQDRFVVRAGERLELTLGWFPSWEEAPPALDVPDRLDAAVQAGEAFADASGYVGPYRAAVERSLLVLRLLSDSRRGGIVAAPTTSLPETFGGERNWDYRFCWLRDASLTLEALLAVGHTDEPRRWRDWLVRAIAGDPQDLQIMYAVDGGRDLPERELPHLPGYADSAPVRIGNAAVGQRQTDVLGEVMMAVETARERGLAETSRSWAIQRSMVNDLADHWEDPDQGLWEIRGPARHFTHSRVMVWAAFDRAVKAVEEHGLEGDAPTWRRLRDAVRDEVLEHGVDPDRQTFTQHYDTTEVDASLLLIPSVGFLPADDPRVLGTIRAVEEDLLRDGLVLRYRTQSGVDGLSGDEHPFLACSFWLVSAYAATGQRDRAVTLMDRLVGLTNDVGLLSEEYDPGNDRMVGNFPQAFSHLALVRAAVHLAEATPDSASR